MGFQKRIVGLSSSMRSSRQARSELQAATLLRARDKHCTHRPRAALGTWRRTEMLAEKTLARSGKESGPPPRGRPVGSDSGCHCSARQQACHTPNNDQALRPAIGTRHCTGQGAGSVGFKVWTYRGVSGPTPSDWGGRHERVTARGQAQDAEPHQHVCRGKASPTSHAAADTRWHAAWQTTGARLDMSIGTLERGPTQATRLPKPKDNSRRITAGGCEHTPRRD